MSMRATALLRRLRKSNFSLRCVLTPELKVTIMAPLLKRRSGREVEGTPLLREHTGQNSYRGFESLLLRQIS
jgi:hypothetical protein